MASEHDNVQKRLAPMQQRFVEEYLVDLNATQAAIRAGYSAKTAESCGSRLLINVKVQAAIAVRRERLLKRTEWTQERVVRQLESIVESDIGNLFEALESGRLVIRSLNNIPAEARRAIASIKVRRIMGAEGQFVEVIECKLWDKLAAIDQLNRIFGFYKPTKVELTATEAAQELARMLGVSPEQLPNVPAADTTVH